MFTLWIDIEKLAHRWMQYKCNRRSACHTRGASIGIYVCAWVGLPLLVDKEKTHNSQLSSDDQSIVKDWNILSWSAVSEPTLTKLPTEHSHGFTMMQNPPVTIPKGDRGMALQVSSYITQVCYSYTPTGLWQLTVRAEYWVHCLFLFALVLGKK